MIGSSFSFVVATGELTTSVVTIISYTVGAAATGIEKTTPEFFSGYYAPPDLSILQEDSVSRLYEP
jgi:hypothetical protein